MGNINGREDGGGAGGDGGSTSSIGNDVAAQDANYIARTGDDGEFMGHSPPPSPRVSGSPLMFTPQVKFRFLISDFRVFPIIHYPFS